MKALDFDAAGIAEYMLEKYVRFGFIDPNARTSGVGFNGVTYLHRMEGEGDAYPEFHFTTYISAHMVWPLLKHHYTVPEKTARSLFIASVILHELGVSHYTSTLPRFSGVD